MMKSLHHFAALATLAALAAMAIACGPPSEGDENGNGNGTLTDHRVIVLDGLAGTASLLDLDETLGVDVGRWMLGDAPNHIVVDGDRALIINSSSHTVQVLDLLAVPSEATVQEVFLGDGTNPMNLALISPDVVLVSLFMTNQLATVDLAAGKVTACIDLPSGADLLPLTGMTPLARPQAIALTGNGKALVALNNMDEGWSPAGNGLLAVVDLGTGVSSDQDPITCGPFGNSGPAPEGAPQVESLIDLGAECLVAGFVKVHEGRAYATCGGSWGAGEGRLSIIDLADLSLLTSVELGGMPGAMLAQGDRLFITDSSEGRVFMTDLAGGVIHDHLDPVILCPSDFDAGLYQFVSDLAPAPGGEIMATCFSSSEVLRFSYQHGADDGTTRHAQITGRAVSGDGAGALAIWETAR